jgi:hypothetical protein
MYQTVVRQKRSCAHSTHLSEMSRSGYAEPMVTWIIDVVRLLIVLTSRHRALALENLALRQQLALYRRTRPKPIMRWRDRLFWIGLRATWGEWISALVVIRALFTDILDFCGRVLAISVRQGVIERRR